MSQMLQLDMFIEQEEPWVKEIYELKEISKSTRESSDKVRKKLFAENGNLNKIVSDLSIRLEIIERNLCNGK